MIPPHKKYWSNDPHRSRDSVSPVCGIFFTKNKFPIFSLLVCLILQGCASGGLVRGSLTAPGLPEAHPQNIGLFLIFITNPFILSQQK